MAWDYMQSTKDLRPIQILEQGVRLAKCSEISFLLLICQLLICLLQYSIREVSRSQ